MARKTSDLILSTTPLDFQWHTLDPFLFCVHHDDAFPPGNERMGPDPDLLRSRNIGMDFQLLDGWRMYHGSVVPGFPQHPHRGFETITLARRGLVDHSDSLGARARFGHGDVQWMTAGKGIVHAEMFPLLNRDAPNPGELFQIWLNLPAEDKFAEPHFKMLWSDTIPQATVRDDSGRATTVTVIAGRYGDQVPPAPPPDSWAARSDSHVAIWTLQLEPGAAFTLPAASADANRVLYLFASGTMQVGGQAIEPGHGVQVRPDAPIPLLNGSTPAEILVLQGRPIGEPVAQQGPFVMNNAGEIRQAMIDYQTTGFGDWPWGRDDPVHDRDEGRFAVHADGRVERRDGDRQEREAG